MDSKQLKDCILEEVIGSDHSFSWRKALTRTRNNPNKHFVFWWRIACYLYAKGGFYKSIAKRIQRKKLQKYNVTIPLTVEIGKGLNIAYLSGVVIGLGCKIGKNCNIKPGVVIGLKEKGGPMDISIGDNVTIGCNTSIIGGVLAIGDNVTIGAQSLVISDIPSNSVYVNKVSPIIISKNKES